MIPQHDRRLSRFTPAGVALIYAVIGALWIAASNFWLAITVSDPLLLNRLEIANELALVAVTSVLLFLFLKARSDSEAAATTGRQAGASLTKPVRLILLFAALVLILPLIGFSIVKTHIPRLEHEAYSNLESIARLKAGQIENWLVERRGDAMVLAADRDFASHVDRFMRQPRDAGLLKPVLERLNILRVANGYDGVILLDVTGHLLTSLGERGDPQQVSPELLQLALNSKQVQRSDIFRDGLGSVHLDWAIPVIAPDARGERAVAVVVLRVSLERFLFPLIQTWPTASASGETVLVREDGGSVVYLNQLRHRTGAPMMLRLPMTNTGLPAAVALHAASSGTVQGMDYRDVRVLAAYRPVSGTDWRIVAKIDRDELLEPLWRMAYWIGLVALAAIVVVMAALRLLLLRR